MQQLKPVASHPHKTSSHVPSALSTSSHVFVRHDAVRTPLQSPYDGPYKILKRTPKFFTLDINGKHKTISLDRLKAAHIDSDGSPDSLLPTPSSVLTENIRPAATASTSSSAPSDVNVRTTRSGRHVHWPARLGFDALDA